MKTQTRRYKMDNQIVNTNSDFLFLYEAVKCNPNGDPDMENKPRIDYETKTNLVTDLRIKRYIRDYFKFRGLQIFVDTLAEKKVTSDKMLNTIINQKLSNENEIKKIFETNPNLKDLWDNLVNGLNEEKRSYQSIKEIYNKKIEKSKITHHERFIKENFTNFNNLLLNAIIKSSLIDIRMFGGAFAVKGFTETYTGPIQINWGYSLNPVELIKSNSITTKFSSEEELEAGSIGKDYRLYYSLLAFHGTINKNTAKKSGLTFGDLDLFREAIIQAIPSTPTRSKLGQYPILYMELEYNENYNGYLRDLRDFIDFKTIKKPIRSFKDIELGFDRLNSLLMQNKDKIKKIHVWETPLAEKKLMDKVISDGIEINTLNFPITKYEK